MTTSSFPTSKSTLCLYLPCFLQDYCLKSEMINSVMQEGQLPLCTVRECQNFIMADSAFAMCKRPMRYVSTHTHAHRLIPSGSLLSGVLFVF